MGKSSEDFQKFLDNQQYTKNGILRYEKIFGKTYVSTGGEKTTEKFCTEYLNLKPGDRVLDIGCGIGGSAFYMAKTFGVDVYGIDLSTNMINIANDYRNDSTVVSPSVKHRVQFHVEDATTMDYPENFYDLVYSRDTILHIQDKEALFKLFFKTLKPGGILLISDYCQGRDENQSLAFKDYVSQRGYHLHTPANYGKIMEKAGFSKVLALNNTEYFLEILNEELTKFTGIKKEMIKEYSEKDYEDISRGWKNKLERCNAGDQVWGFFKGTKNF